VAKRSLFRPRARRRVADRDCVFDDVAVAHRVDQPVLQDVANLDRFGWSDDLEDNPAAPRRVGKGEGQGTGRGFVLCAAPFHDPWSV
jgi:hypothetical protein